MTYGHLSEHKMEGLHGRQKITSPSFYDIDLLFLLHGATDVQEFKLCFHG